MEDLVLNLVTKIVLSTATRADFLNVSTEIDVLYEALEDYTSVFKSFNIIFIPARGKDSIRLDEHGQKAYKYQLYYEYPDNVGSMIILYYGVHLP